MKEIKCTLAVLCLATLISNRTLKAEEELKGLDIGEHGMEAYAGFQVFVTT